MIDIHNHIIFGLDDGAQSFEDSVAMVAMAYQDGIRTIITTPHYNRHFQYSIQLMEQNYTKVKDYFKNKYPDMRFFIGNECSLDDKLGSDLVSRKCRTLAGSCFVLIELNYAAPFSMTKRMLSDIISSGYKPVIAHCERLVEEKADLIKIIKLQDIGCNFQVNADFFTNSKKGWKVKEIFKLIDSRIINYISSDAHDLIYRTTILSNAYKIVVRNIGREIADEVFCLNGKDIIMDGIYKDRKDIAEIDSLSI